MPATYRDRSGRQRAWHRLPRWAKDELAAASDAEREAEVLRRQVAQLRSEVDAAQECNAQLRLLLRRREDQLDGATDAHGVVLDASDEER